MNDNETWIEFECWMDDISICGYMNLADADDEAPLQFYGYDGLECGSHISNTRYPSYDESQEVDWEQLCEWFRIADPIDLLVTFAEESKKLSFTIKDDMGRTKNVELYINCSKF